VLHHLREPTDGGGIGRTPPDQVGAALGHLKYVVEVVRDAARQLSKRGHFPGLDEVNRAGFAGGCFVWVRRP
ncbi:MAG: hypothetical protein WAL77_12475, partial [Candidatus Dormiibacterota bacterium]